KGARPCLATESPLRLKSEKRRVKPAAGERDSVLIEKQSSRQCGPARLAEAEAAWQHAVSGQVRRVFKAGLEELAGRQGNVRHPTEQVDKEDVAAKRRKTQHSRAATKTRNCHKGTQRSQSRALNSGS